jgi:hypothetical protein
VALFLTETWSSVLLYQMIFCSLSIGYAYFQAWSLGFHLFLRIICKKVIKQRQIAKLSVRPTQWMMPYYRIPTKLDRVRFVYVTLFNFIIASNSHTNLQFRRNECPTTVGFFVQTVSRFHKCMGGVKNNYRYMSKMRDFRLPSRNTWELRSYWFLRSE